MVVAWGDNSYGQTNVPPNLINPVAVAAGESFSMALNSDGTVSVWGDNSLGQTNVPPEATNVVSIAAGLAHCLALRADGTVIAWGNNNYGQAIVPTDLSNVVAIAAGDGHSLALRADGTVAAWRDGRFGQTNVPTGLTNAVSVRAGGNYSVALSADGAGWGNFSLINILFWRPAFYDATALAAGRGYVIALQTNARVTIKATTLMPPKIPLDLATGSATIVSDNPGTVDPSISKSTAQDGNVVVNSGSGTAVTVVSGGGEAIVANGRVNWNVGALIDTKRVSQTNYGTANEVPDCTTQGTANTLFDINRLIAVADQTPGGPSTLGNNHFTNFASFYKAITNSSPTNPIEGVVVVDVRQVDANNLKYFPLTTNLAPKGINIKGTLVFNFTGSGWDATTEKIVIAAAVNINAANITSLVATNPATYTSGYPPVYNNPQKNPTNIDISSMGYSNFAAADKLPALVGTIGVIDLHGPLNISGGIYTPSYVEIENKSSGQTQYVNGPIIAGNGVYLENLVSNSTSIFSSAVKSPPVLISAYGSNNIALRADGTVTTWGLPQNYTATLTNVSSVAAGGSHYLALVANGPVAPPTLINPVVNSSNFTVSLLAQSGRVYRLERTDVLSSNWQTLPLVAGTGGTISLCDPSVGTTTGFYRVRQW